MGLKSQLQRAAAECHMLVARAAARIQGSPCRLHLQLAGATLQALTRSLRAGAGLEQARCWHGWADHSGAWLAVRRAPHELRAGEGLAQARIAGADKPAPTPRAGVSQPGGQLLHSGHLAGC